jgi:hypothetical protein
MIASWGPCAARLLAYPSAWPGSRFFRLSLRVVRRLRERCIHHAVRRTHRTKKSPTHASWRLARVKPALSWLKASVPGIHPKLLLNTTGAATTEPTPQQAIRRTKFPYLLPASQPPPFPPALPSPLSTRSLVRRGRARTPNYSEPKWRPTLPPSHPKPTTRLSCARRPAKSSSSPFGLATPHPTP